MPGTGRSETSAAASQAESEPDDWIAALPTLQHPFTERGSVCMRDIWHGPSAAHALGVWDSWSVLLGWGCPLLGMSAWPLPFQLSQSCPGLCRSLLPKHPGSQGSRSQLCPDLCGSASIKYTHGWSLQTCYVWQWAVSVIKGWHVICKAGAAS